MSKIKEKQEIFRLKGELEREISAHKETARCHVDAQTKLNGLLLACKPVSEWLWTHASNFSNRDDIRRELDAAIANAEKVV